MKEIVNIALINATHDKAEDFHKQVMDAVKKIQSNGYEVDIKYQATNELLSALILGSTDNK